MFGLRSTLCNHCGHQSTANEQHDHNIDLLAAATKALTTITPKEIRLIRAKLGLTQAEAQKMFGGGPNAFSKYERGEVMPSAASAELMQLVAAVPEAFRWLARRHNVKVEIRKVDSVAVTFWPQASSGSHEAGFVEVKRQQLFGMFELDENEFFRAGTGLVMSEVATATEHRLGSWTLSEKSSSRAKVFHHG